MTTPLASSTSADSNVSLPHAARTLEIGQRRLMMLVAAGRIEVVGKGSARRVTAASLAAEIGRRKEKWKSKSEKAEILGNVSGSFPTICGAPLDEPNNQRQTDDMLLRFPVQIKADANELLPLSRAAARVGISEPLLRKAIERGQVDSVQVGERRRISVGGARALGAERTTNSVGE